MEYDPYIYLEGLATVVKKAEERRDNWFWEARADPRIPSVDANRYGQYLDECVEEAKQQYLDFQGYVNRLNVTG